MKCECVSCAECHGTGRSKWLDDDCDYCGASGLEFRCDECCEVDDE